MNPLDSKEILFVIKEITEELPNHNKNGFVIPEGPNAYCKKFPKNIMDYSASFAKKYLDQNQHIIEEILHRNSKHFLPKWMKKYLSMTYSRQADVLGHDSIFKIATDFESRLRHRVGFTNSWLGQFHGSAPHGAQLTSGGTGGGDTFETAGVLVGNRLSLGNIGDEYNQIGIDCFNSAGQFKLACYNESSSLPNALYSASQLGSTNGDSAFTAQNVSAWLLTTTRNWVAYRQQNSQRFKWQATGSSDKYQTAGGSFTDAFPDPFGSGSSPTNVIYHCQINHS